MYDLGVQTLAKEMETGGIAQIWMVDDLAAAGKPEELKKWYENLKTNGPKYGYNLSRAKSYILAKDPKALTSFKEDITKGDLKHEGGKNISEPPSDLTNSNRSFSKEKSTK